MHTKDEACNEPWFKMYSFYSANEDNVTVLMNLYGFCKADVAMCMQFYFEVFLISQYFFSLSLPHSPLSTLSGAKACKHSSARKAIL